MYVYMFIILCVDVDSQIFQSISTIKSFAKKRFMNVQNSLQINFSRIFFLYRWWWKKISFAYVLIRLRNEKLFVLIIIAFKYNNETIIIFCIWTLTTCPVLLTVPKIGIHFRTFFQKTEVLRAVEKLLCIPF